MPAPLIDVSGLEVRVGKKQLLHDIDMSVSASEIVTVIGPNGAGKSTLLKAVIGLLPAYKGKVSRREKLRIGYTPQKMLFETTMPLPVFRFLSLAGKVDKETVKQVSRRTAIEPLMKSQMASLSGGELQRVLLARALLRQPDLLILDEPTQGLDQAAEERFYKLLAEIRDETGVGVLMVSHDLHVVMAESNRVVCLNGHVCCSGAPAQVSNDPKYLEMFGTRAALAPYQHQHDHRNCDHD